jgi:hypothetical protein
MSDSRNRATSHCTFDVVHLRSNGELCAPQVTDTAYKAHQSLGFYIIPYETPGVVYSKLLVVRNKKRRIMYGKQTENQNQVKSV